MRSRRFEKWQPTCPTLVEGLCLTDLTWRAITCRRSR